MLRNLVFIFLLSGLTLLAPLRAIETSGGFVSTPVTVSGWNSGWSTVGATGADYVGQVNSASGVYLGDNWVLTAGHVGAGSFTLAGITYSAVSGSAHTLTSGSTSVDLTLFQISGTLTLNPLTIDTTPLTPFSSSNSPSQVVMIGYGTTGTQHETWGVDTVDLINQSVDLRPSYPYVSNDFISYLGSVSNGSTVTTNNSILYVGDSGGGDFTYDSSSHSWVLAGINEVTDTTDTPNFSGFVQLSTYASQIQSITGIGVVPEPSTWALFGLGVVFLALCFRRSQRTR